MLNINAMIEMCSRNTPRYEICALGPDHEAMGRKVFWRAEFDVKGNDVTLYVEQYPVYRETQKGAWVFSSPYDLSPGATRWVSNSARSSFVKPTREEAIESAVARLYHHIGHLEFKLSQAKKAAGLVHALLPKTKYANFLPSTAVSLGLEKEKPE